MKAKKLIQQLTWLVESKKNPEVKIAVKDDLLDNIIVGFEEDSNSVILFASEKHEWGEEDDE